MEVITEEAIWKFSLIIFCLCPYLILAQGLVQGFSDVFRGYQNGTLGKNGLKNFYQDTLGIFMNAAGL